jgi:hypothetical protein
MAEQERLKQLTIRMPEVLWHQLGIIAKQNFRTATQEIVRALSLHVEASNANQKEAVKESSFASLTSNNVSKPVNSMPKPVSPRDSGDTLEPGNLWDNDGVQYHPIPRSEFERKVPEFQKRYLADGRKVID